MKTAHDLVTAARTRIQEVSVDDAEPTIIDGVRCLKIPLNLL
ncbi:MAG: hypothetical protein Q8Q81_18725 [Oxalobacteraceae bacterium]|nr:hypothetical protein [Oxalobacteraceae bacterium]